jgi:hypothetical protein
VTPLISTVKYVASRYAAAVKPKSKPVLKPKAQQKKVQMQHRHKRTVSAATAPRARAGPPRIAAERSVRHSRRSASAQLTDLQVEAVSRIQHEAPHDIKEETPLEQEHTHSSSDSTGSAKPQPKARSKPKQQARTKKTAKVDQGELFLKQRTLALQSAFATAAAKHAFKNKRDHALVCVSCVCVFPYSSIVSIIY